MSDGSLLSNGPLGRIADRVGSAWWVLLVVGIAWVIIGFVVAQYSTASVVSIALISCVVLLLGGVAEIVAAAVTSGGWRVLHIVFAILFIIGGITLLASPGATFVSLAALIGFFFIVTGVIDIISSLFAAGESVPGWWLQLISGILQIILGAIASRSIENGVVVLITVVSLAAIFRGIAEIAVAFSVRGLKRA